MKTMTMMVCAVTLGLGLAACGNTDDHGNYVPNDEGRKETESMKNLDTVGYGYARKKVDKALDLNDQRVDQLNKELEKQEQ